MIIVRLMGGLGNQMFQYAAAKTTAKRLRTDLLLDLGWYDEMRGSERSFALDCFKLPEKIARFKDVMRLFPGRAVCDCLHKNEYSRLHIKFSRVVTSYMKKLKLLPQEDFLYSKHNETLFVPIRLSRVYVQKAPYYTSDFIDITDDTYMIGFWESEKFWSDCEKDISLYFSFDISLYEHPLLNKIREMQSVSIHIRRGDKSIEGSAHLASNLSYIKSAIQIIESKVLPTFFIFSDDINWCKEHLPPILRKTPYSFVENLGNSQVARDLFLITQCKHNIVGPSTFSWWGAWLNANPEKIVIAPHETLWYKNAEGRYDLLPQDWIIIK